MTRDELLGRWVVATNEAGGKWGGRCTTFTLEGLAVVECEWIDIGYGRHWFKRAERRKFAIECVEVED